MTLHHQDWIVDLRLWRPQEPSLHSCLPFPLLWYLMWVWLHEKTLAWGSSCLNCSYISATILGILRSGSQTIGTAVSSAKQGRLDLIISEVPYGDNVFGFTTFQYLVSFLCNISGYQWLGCPDSMLLCPGVVSRNWPEDTVTSYFFGDFPKIGSKNVIHDFFLWSFVHKHFLLGL